MSNEGDKAWPNGLGYAGDEAGSLSAHTREQEQHCDCIVVGGRPAGLSAALVLGRAYRSVLVFDSGDKRNEARPSGRQVLRHPSVHLRCLAVCDVDARAAKEEQPDPPEEPSRHSVLCNGRRITETERFVVTTRDGREWKSRKLILATGVQDLIPDVEGFGTYWARGIWMLLWSQDVVLFTDGEVLAATDKELELLRQHGVSVIEQPIARAVGDGSGHMAGLVLRDGCFAPLSALFFNTGRIQTSALPKKMGLPVDEWGGHRVTKGNVLAVHGLYVAGNCATAPLKLVVTAASQGAVTGAKVYTELLYEELGLARDQGAQRHTRSLKGSRASPSQCHRQIGGHHHTQPTKGSPWEEAQEMRLGTTGAQ